MLFLNFSLSLKPDCLIKLINDHSKYVKKKYFVWEIIT